MDCHTGWRFLENGNFGAVDFNQCNNACAGTPHAGDYTITGNTLIIISGLTSVNNEITIEDDLLTVIGNDLEDANNTTIFFEKLTCNN